MLLTVDEMTKALIEEGVDTSIVSNPNIQLFLTKIVRKKSFRGFEVEYSLNKSSFVIHTKYESRFFPNVKYAVAKIGDEKEESAYLVVTRVRKESELDWESAEPDVFGLYSAYGPRNYYDLPATRVRK